MSRVLKLPEVTRKDSFERK